MQWLTLCSDPEWPRKNYRILTPFGALEKKIPSFVAFNIQSLPRCSNRTAVQYRNVTQNYFLYPPNLKNNNYIRLRTEIEKNTSVRQAGLKIRRASAETIIIIDSSVL
jgi:hypothetical protein